MSTQNKKALTDYYANAAGGGIRYETAKFHGFQMAVSGFYIFNIGSSDFTKPDSATGQYNRYETALFDVTDPANKKDLDRLEEFYIKYNLKNSNIVFGRQLINTAFIKTAKSITNRFDICSVHPEARTLPFYFFRSGYLCHIATCNYGF